MMNSSDEKDNDNLSMPGIPGLPKSNPFGGDMPEELRRPRATSTDNSIPDFLTRKNDTIKEETSLPKIPDFETFKKQMEANAFGFDDDDDIRKMPSIPKKQDPIAMPPVAKAELVDEDDDDDLGFDVDELVKKIDAKIAELEAEEKRNKEKEEREKNALSENNIPSVTSTPFTDLSSLGEDITFEVSSPKFEEKIEENFVSEPIQPIVEEFKPEVKAETKPVQVNLNLDDESEDDDFFDDFFDN